MSAFIHNDFQTPLWLKQTEYYEARLATLRARLENASLGEIETAVLRGQIKEIKHFLGLPNPAPKVQPVSQPTTGDD